MKVDEYGFARVRIDAVRPVVLGAVEITTGDGTPDDIVRRVTLLFYDGRQVAEIDGRLE